eukprot:623078-Amphidinium_carterae.1
MSANAHASLVTHNLASRRGNYGLKLSCLGLFLTQLKFAYGKVGCSKLQMEGCLKFNHQQTA